MAERVYSYAQNREDIILSGFFKDKIDGFYVDVGAGDPEELSVTKYFYDRGWNGINIEPNIVLYKKLKSERPRDVNLNIAVGAKNESNAIFRQYDASGLSTLSEARKSELEHADDPTVLNYKDKNIEINTLSQVVNQYAVERHIDFMKIDVEGYEREVILGNDWSKCRPSVLCIEANHIESDWRSLLDKNNYKKIYDDGLNEYYVDEKSDVVFRYAWAAIGREIVPAYLKEEIELLEQDNLRLSADLARLRRQLNDKDEHIEYLHQHVSELNRLRNMVKNLIFKINFVINMRLGQKINKKKLYPALPKELTDSSSILDILKSIKDADYEVFVRRPSLKERVQIEFARGLYAVYRLIAKSTMRIGRFVKRSIKRQQGVS